MKKFFLLLCLLTTTAFAAKDAVIFPRVYSTGYSVQVQVWNHTNKQVSCSGPIYMDMQDGPTQTSYYFDVVMPHFQSFRVVYPNTMKNNIRFVRHSIMCF